MKITFAEIAAPKSGSPKSGALVVIAFAGRQLGRSGTDLDKILSGALTRAMGTGHFKGEAGQWVELLAPVGLSVSRILIAGLGKAEKADALAYEGVGGEAIRRLALGGDRLVTFMVDAAPGGKLNAATSAARLAYGAELGGYRFDKYRTKLKEHEKPSIGEIVVMTRGAAGARKAHEPLAAIAAGVCFTRDLVSEPANIIYPESLAAECRKLTKLGVKVEVLGEAEMKKLGMGSLLGVGQGSERESQLVVMQWQGLKSPKKDAKPIAFLGKGVCFDTGGISIKPAGGMEEMKWDMGGAGTVIGLMMALAGRKAKANVIGIVGLVENMPSGTAQRPGDVVTSMSGQTIEVLNTDAEGRLVLADALWYCQDRFKPRFMVDLATLTGACIIALGHEHAGLFANNDTLAERIFECGKAESELVWRLPLHDAYDKALRSDIADVANITAPGTGAGSITAAQFLQRFVNDVPWAHLDIAGMAWNKKDRPTSPKGGSGFGVRLLNRLVQQYYEGR